jgi:phosphate:Na+ symporter
MSHGEKNLVTEVIAREDHALAHVARDGEKRIYFPAKSMWLRLKQLRAAQQLAEPLDADKQPTLCTSLHGVARLDGQGLSIIGDVGNAAHSVEVSFEARDVSRADRLGLRKLEDELGLSLSDVPLGTARLGVNRPDAESGGLGASDQWWLACHIPDACINALSKAMSDGQLGAVELGLTLRNLYTAEDAPATPLREPDLFLMPNPSDGTIELPEIATGYVTHLRIDLASTQLPGGHSDDLKMNPVADAISSLALKLGGLMVTVRWRSASFSTLHRDIPPPAPLLSLARSPRAPTAEQVSPRTRTAMTRRRFPVMDTSQAKE